MNSSKKKIIYVVGCGRSGTTLLGFVLGNSTSTLDLGEVLDFVRFRGCPNGFGPGTENYAFWQSVFRRVESDMGEIDFVRLARLQSAVDSHRSLLPLVVLGNMFRKRDLVEYRRFLRALYDGIQAESSADVLIDSSKYPSRLTHLREIYPDDRVHVVHLIRNPIDLARALASSEQSKPRSFLQALFYFFVINIFSLMATRGLTRERCVRVHYEDLVSRPEATLERLGDTFSIDTAPAISKIQKREPLHRGHVFNGNRMRMKGHVVFRRSSVVTTERSRVELLVEHVATIAFGSDENRRPGQRD